MLALYRSGRQADALAAYRDLQRRLSEQLGIDPTPAVQELHERMLRQDADLAAATRARPADETSRIRIVHGMVASMA